MKINKYLLHPYSFSSAQKDELNKKSRQHSKDSLNLEHIRLSHFKSSDNHLTEGTRRLRDQPKSANSSIAYPIKKTKDNQFNKSNSTALFSSASLEPKLKLVNQYLNDHKTILKYSESSVSSKSSQKTSITFSDAL